MEPIFTVRDAPATLARVPLRPAVDDDPDSVDPVLDEAMFLASRQAGAAVAAAAAAPEMADAASRLAATRRAYALRSRWRPTPHGVFAGVATARFSGAGETAQLRLGGGHRARTAVSGGWLAAVEEEFMTEAAALPLRFTASNLVVHRGSRLEHPWRAKRATVRATEATLLIMGVCADGATAAGIVEEVTRRWPVPESVIHATITQLVRGGFLLTDLLPTDIRSNPLGHLLDRLPGSHPKREPLARLRRLLADADLHPIGAPARVQALTSARDLADQICVHERPVTVDVAADAHIVLPADLPADAAQAAGVLWRAGAWPEPLSSWHDQFVRRYGPDRLVPLLEATDAAAGLGIDDLDEDAGSSARRTAALARLLTDALAHGHTQVVLDEATIAELAGDGDARPPRTAEISVQLFAASHDDLVAGRLQLAVTRGGTNSDGCTTGRFADLLTGVWPGPPDRDDAALVAEIVAQPRIPQGAGLSPPTGFASWRIPVGVPAQDGDLDLNDLHLVSNGRHLSCWSARHDRPVIPVLYSRLNAGLLPQLAYFLQLLGATGSRPLHAWSWGPLGHGPFQPGVRFRQTVLAPARWVLPPSLTRAVDDRAGWSSALETWRKTMAPPPPDIVVTDDGDRRLPLDLRRGDDRELLRRYVRRGLAAVCEQPGGPDAVHAVVAGPAGRHVAELVVPLAARTIRPQPAPVTSLPRRAAGEGLFLPGAPWLTLAIRAPYGCHEEILVQLADFAGQLGGHVDGCFWLRFSNAAHGPHLRVRFHGDPGVLGGTVLPAASAWCEGLIRQRLSGGFAVEHYDQEIERYGGPDAIGAAERVFSADSRLVLDILTATTDSDQRLMAAATSAAAIADTVAGADPVALGHRRLDRDGRRRLEDLRRQVRAARPYDLGDPPPRLPVEVAWSARQEALVAYAAMVKPARRAACASAMIHMHANRLLGVAKLEPLTRALAADILAHQPPRTP